MKQIDIYQKSIETVKEAKGIVSTWMRHEIKDT